MRTGIIVGLFGAIGSFSGTSVASLMPAGVLIWISASLLFLSSFLIWARTRVSTPEKHEEKKTLTIWLHAPLIGLITGFLSGCFGIGSTPLIQLGLLIFLGLTIQQAAATSMLILIPISLSATIGFATKGMVDPVLLIQIVAGTMLGSYVGAKFTKKAPAYILRAVMILLPIFGGLLLLK